MLTKLELTELFKRIDRFVGELLAQNPMMSQEEKDWQIEKAVQLKAWIKDQLA